MGKAYRKRCETFFSKVANVKYDIDMFKIIETIFYLMCPDDQINQLWKSFYL
jgi:hypothetical protein